VRQALRKVVALAPRYRQRRGMPCAQREPCQHRCLLRIAKRMPSSLLVWAGEAHASAQNGRTTRVEASAAWQRPVQRQAGRECFEVGGSEGMNVCGRRRVSCRLLKQASCNGMLRPGDACHRAPVVQEG